MRELTVYLPIGCKWRNHAGGEIVEGGRTLVADAPLNRIPVFLREGSPVAEFLISGKEGVAVAERK